MPYLGKMIKVLYYDSKGNMWIGSEEGGLSVITNDQIKIFTKQDEIQKINIHNFNEKNPNLKLNSNAITTICEYNNDLWIGTLGDGINFVQIDELLSLVRNNLKKITINSIKSEYSKQDKLGTNKITCLYKDSKNNLWIGTYGGGLYQYIGNNSFIKYKSNDLLKNSISNDYILTIFEDQSGLIWIGTSGGGINKCNANKINFSSIKRSLNPENGLQEYMIFSILQDKEKNLWIGTRNGLSFYNNKTKKYFHYSNNDKFPPGIKNDMIRSLSEDSLGNIWIGSTKYGLFKYNKYNKTFTRYSEDSNSKNSITSNNIRSLLVDDRINLFIGTANGINILNLETGSIQKLFGTNDTTTVSSSYIYYIYKDEWNNLWFGTKDGLSLYNRITKKFLRYYYERGAEINEVITITSGKDGKIYFGTSTKGIFCLTPTDFIKGKPVYDSKSKIFRPFRNNLLENEFIYSIRTDNFGRIWFGTNNGLWSFNPKKSILKKYDVYDGLLHNEFNTNATFKASDGTLFFGGVNGINYFKPDYTYDYDYKPKIAITSFKIYDKEISFNKDINILDNIELSYNDNYFSFEFAILDYSDSYNNQFIYKLEGFDKDWINSGNRNFASYTNLGGGDYIFRVKGTSKNGVWSENEKVIKLHITPPFYKTPLFQILVLFILIGIVLFYIKIRTKKFNEQKKELETLVKIRTEEIKQSEERYKSFVSQTSEGIWRCEFDIPIDLSLSEEAIYELILQHGYIAECNDTMAKFFGYSKSEELINCKINEVFDLNNIENKNLIKSFIKSNYILINERSVITLHNESKKHFTNNLTGIIEKGYLVRIWGTLFDITEKIKLEEEISKTQKLESLGIFAGGLAHDFNNLLTGILGNSSLAKMYTDKDSKLYKRLTEIEKASFRAKDLTFQLMTFAKGGAPIKKTVDLKKTLKDTVEFSLSGSKSKCQFSIQDDLWFVDCDESQIAQVISNLVINADQAMPNGGIIEVNANNVEFSVETDITYGKIGKYVHFEIKDNGVGISPENINKIYDPFFTTKPKGKGLGLSSVYSIVKRHDGFLEVKSELGKGSTFSIYLKASNKSIEKSETKESPFSKFTGKILLMDDEEIIREFTSTLLTEMGFETDTANTGEEAVKKYVDSMRTQKYKVVILDLTIPDGMGGKETAENILKIDKDALIFVSSGYSNDPIMSNYSNYGLAGVIPKPYKAEELYNILAQVLNKNGE